MYRIAILDDNEQHQKALEALVRAFFESSAAEVARFEGADEFLRAVEMNKYPFDIALVDIVLDDERENGIALAKKLLEENGDCQVIFVSGYPEYWQDAYAAPHLWFIQKSEVDKLLPQALGRAKERCDKLRTQKIGVKISRGTAVVRLRDILYFERVLRLTRIVTTEGVLETSEKIDELLNRIDSSDFVRCHRSFAVNADYIRDFTSEGVSLADDSFIRVSRAYRPTVTQAITRLFLAPPRYGKDER